jgi:hypothetical protein
MILAQCRSNALSKALRATFFSVADQVASSLNCLVDSIEDLPPPRQHLHRARTHHGDVLPALVDQFSSRSHPIFRIVFMSTTTIGEITICMQFDSRSLH